MRRGSRSQMREGGEGATNSCGHAGSGEAIEESEASGRSGRDREKRRQALEPRGIYGREGEVVCTDTGSLSAWSTWSTSRWHSQYVALARTPCTPRCLCTSVPLRTSCAAARSHGFAGAGLRVLVRFLAPVGLGRQDRAQVGGPGLSAGAGQRRGGPTARGAGCGLDSGAGAEEVGAPNVPCRGVVPRAGGRCGGVR